MFAGCVVGGVTVGVSVDGCATVNNGMRASRAVNVGRKGCNLTQKLCV